MLAGKEILDLCARFLRSAVARTGISNGDAGISILCFSQKANIVKYQVHTKHMATSHMGQSSSLPRKHILWGQPQQHTVSP